jgi:hypothetical protein
VISPENIVFQNCIHAFRSGWLFRKLIAKTAFAADKRRYCGLPARRLYATGRDEKKEKTNDKMANVLNIFIKIFLKQNPSIITKVSEQQINLEL